MYQHRYDEAGRSVEDVTEFLLDMREYDVPYHMRVTIDLKVNGVVAAFTAIVAGQARVDHTLT